MSGEEPLPLHTPSWKVVKRYHTDVLVGNWREERLQFPKHRYHHESLYRTQYTFPRGFGPDIVVRKKAQLHNQEGIGKRLLFRHHDDRYLDNKVSLYDEEYNNRWPEKNLPERRHWRFIFSAWVPERSEYPLYAPPTNFGLLQKIQKRQKAETQQEKTHMTVYNTQYKPHTWEDVMASRAARMADRKHCPQPSTVLSEEANVSSWLPDINKTNSPHSTKNLK